MRITVWARAKINWSLDVRDNREDGYHELDMLMQRVELADELTFENARWLTLSVNGRPLPVGGRNLVLQAANALNEYVGKRRGARISLTKNIPVRAGLGGGSADCAAALLALNRLWKLRLPLERLMEIGRGLGADVPYCLASGFARVSGMGERIEPLGEGEALPLLLLHVGRGLSTSQVFARFDETGASGVETDMAALAAALRARDLGRAAALSSNALEASAVALMPEIGRVMADMRARGARVVRMSGSGSTVFGAFRTAAEAMAAAETLPGAVFTWTC